MKPFTTSSLSMHAQLASTLTTGTALSRRQMLRFGERQLPPSS